MTDKELKGLKVGDKIKLTLEISSNMDADGYFKCRAGNDERIYKADLLRWGELVDEKGGKDSVTTFDLQSVELQGLEVLVRLVPFVERDVEERCDRIRERREEEGHLCSSGGFDSIDRAREFRCWLHEKYAPLLAREEERLVRLRKAILERAERVFPELKAEAEEEGEDFPAGGGDAAWGAMNSKQ